MYTQDFKEVPIRKALEQAETEPDIERDWTEESFGADDFSTEKIEHAMKKTNRFARGLLYVSAVFLAVAVIIGAISIFRGTGISSKNVSISIEGPGTASGGEELAFDVVVRNKNTEAIEQGEMVLHLPDGISLVTDKGTEEGTVRLPIETLLAEGTLRKQLRVVPYGAEKEEKKIPIVLEFRFSGQSATWESKNEYAFTITSSPVNISVASIEEVSAGQAFDLTIKIESNTDKSLPGALLKIDYPQGFRRTSSSPEPTFGENLWRIGEVVSGASSEVHIRGVMEGDAGQEKVFTITLGKQSDRDERAIGTVYNATTQSIVVKQPFIEVETAVNGQEGDMVSVTGGEAVRVDLDWKSTGGANIVDAEISVKLKGSALDRYTVSSNAGGFYNSKEDTIIWTKQGVPELTVVGPSDGGTVSFSFKTLSPITDQGKRLRNPTVVFEVSVRGRSISSANVPEQIDTFITRTIKIDTNLTLSAKARYFGGNPFTNTGPIPPRAEQETTYTIILAVSNVSNDAQDVVVRTRLPIHARFLGTSSPASEKLSNPTGQEIVWDVGTVKAGVGITAAPREVAFQVGITPSISQISQAPALTEEIQISGKDTFTGSPLSGIQQPLTTRLFADPLAPRNHDLVTE